MLYLWILLMSLGGAQSSDVAVTLEHMPLDETVSWILATQPDWEIPSQIRNAHIGGTKFFPRCGNKVPWGQKLGDYVFLASPNKLYRGTMLTKPVEWSFGLALSDSTVLWEGTATSSIQIAMCKIGKVAVAERITEHTQGLRIFEPTGVVAHSRVWLVEPFPNNVPDRSFIESGIFKFSPSNRYLICCVTRQRDQDPNAGQIVSVFDLSTGEEWSVQTNRRRLSSAQFLSNTEVKLQFVEYTAEDRPRIFMQGEERPHKTLDLITRRIY